MEYDVGIWCSVSTWNWIVEYPFIWTKKKYWYKISKVAFYQTNESVWRATFYSLIFFNVIPIKLVPY